MIKRLSIATVLVLAIVASSSGQQGTNWVKVSPLGGGFTVMMPAKPEEETKAESDYSSHTFIAKTTKTIFLVSYGDYAPSIRLDEAGELAANRDNFVRNLSAKLIESKDMTKDGRPGLEFTAESDMLTARCRVYLFGNRVFMIAAAVFKGNTDAENVERFVSSFAFTKS